MVLDCERSGETVLLQATVNSVTQYRAAIGGYYHRCMNKKMYILQKLCNHIYFLYVKQNIINALIFSGLAPLVCVCCNMHAYKVVFTLLMLCGDVHPHPGPSAHSKNPYKNVSICHINARSLVAQNPALCVGYHKIDEIHTTLVELTSMTLSVYPKHG